MQRLECRVESKHVFPKEDPDSSRMQNGPKDTKLLVRNSEVSHP